MQVVWPRITAVCFRLGRLAACQLAYWRPGLADSAATFQNTRKNVADEQKPM